MNENGFSYEIIFVDDGSKDRSWEIISDLKIQKFLNDNIKLKEIDTNEFVG